MESQIEMFECNKKTFHRNWESHKDYVKSPEFTNNIPSFDLQYTFLETQLFPHVFSKRIKNIYYRLGTVNSKSFISKVSLRIKCNSN